MGGGAVLGYRDSLVEYLYKQVDNITGFPVNAAGSRAMGNLEPAQIHSQIMWSGGIAGFTNIATRLLRSTIWCVLGYMMHGIIVFSRHRFTKEEVISYQDLTVPSHMHSLLINTSVISSASMLMGEEKLPSSELSTDKWDCMGIFNSEDKRTVIEADVAEQMGPLNHTLRNINVAGGERELIIISGGGNFGQPASVADKTVFVPCASPLEHGHLIGTQDVLNKGSLGGRKIGNIISGGGNFGQTVSGADETAFVPWASPSDHGHLIGTQHVLNKV